ncbi:hypothetical protein D3I60_14075 [Brevibacterium permense]|nr:hypothetical protein [Brevibacterium permense]
MTHSSDLEWSPIADLEVGEAYTLSTSSPLTYILVGKHTGRGGRAEYDATTIVGPGGRGYTRSYFRGDLEVLVVPPEEVGARIADAAESFSTRSFTGREHISLSSDSWPNSVLAQGVAA